MLTINLKHINLKNSNSIIIVTISCYCQLAADFLNAALLISCLYLLGIQEQMCFTSCIMYRLGDGSILKLVMQGF